MANRLNTNPIYIDIFNADVTIAKKGVPVTITKIVMLSAADGDIFRLEDEAGNRLVHMVNLGAADTQTEDFNGKGLRCNSGLAIDVSDCTGMAATDGTDAVWIYTT